MSAALTPEACARYKREIAARAQARLASALPLFAQDREIAGQLRQFLERVRGKYERDGLDVDALLALLPRDDDLAFDIEHIVCGAVPHARRAAFWEGLDDFGVKTPSELTAAHGRQPAAATPDAQGGAGPPAGAA